MKVRSPTALYGNMDSQFSDAAFLRSQRKMVRPATASKVSFASQNNTKDTLKTWVSPKSASKVQRIQSAAIFRQTQVAPRLFSSTSETTLLSEQLQHRILNRYQAESFLSVKHDTLLQSLRIMDQEVINHLNLNHFSLHHLASSSTGLLDQDPALAYSLYDALSQLDRAIIQPLFTLKNVQYSVKKDSIGQPLQENETPFSRFRLEYLKQFTSILNEPMAQLIRKAGLIDRDISTFVEGIWKFLVVLFDTIIQWNQDRCKNFVNEQVASIRQANIDLEEKVLKLQEQLIVKVKGNQLRVAVEQKKYHTLLDKHHSLMEDMDLLHRQYKELGSLDNAQGEMFVMGQKLKEMNETIQKVDRAHVDRKHELDHQITNLASIFVKRHTTNKMPALFIQEKYLISPLFDSEVDNYASLHPICPSLLYMALAKPEPIDIDPLRYFFLEEGTLNPNKSPSELFIELHGRHQAASFMEWLLQEQSSSVTKILCIIFGVRREQQIHSVVLGRFVTIMKSVLGDRGLRQLKNPLEPTWKESFVEPLLLERIITRQENGDVIETYADLLLMVLEELQTNDNERWKQRKAKYLTNISRMGLHGQWSTIEPPGELKDSIDYLDDTVIWDYMMITYQRCFRDVFLGKGAYRDEKAQLRMIEQGLDEIRYISLNHPRIFQTTITAIPPTPPVTASMVEIPDNQQRRQSQIKRVGTFQQPPKTAKKEKKK